jgi:hypothetical protein
MRPARALTLLALAASALVPAALRAAPELPVAMTVRSAVHHDTSRPLRDLVRPIVTLPGTIRTEPAPTRRTPGSPDALDPVTQTAATLPARTTVVKNFAGLGVDFPGYSPSAIPPDTTGAAGRTQYVQWVNSEFVVLDKHSGKALLGPAMGRDFFRDFGGECERRNDGDPIVNYDRFANRWVVQQFAITSGNYECVAVSVGPDATGPYHRYAFEYRGMNDYPKAGVWSHSYVATYNMFDAESGTKVCAWDRLAMLAGKPAREVCFQLRSSDPLLLPADADGTRPPGMGDPVPLAGLGSTLEGTPGLAMYSLRVDWKRPSAASLSPPDVIEVADFGAACLGYDFGSRITSACIPQPGIAAAGVGPLGLDALADRLMFRLAWRKFGNGREAMVATHSVDALPTAVAAVRWYEIDRPRAGTAWRVAQQGSYAPDRDSRWMGSIAMDKNGGIAVGYSVSGVATFPSIRLAGRTAKDPKGQLSREVTVANGFGSQTTASLLSRWGDYSTMQVDPVDDCTFWYTTEYMTEVGVFNWSTRVVAAKLPGC